MTDQAVRDNLRRARKRANLRQKDVADAIAVDVRTFQRWEKGEVDPQGGWDRYLADLAEALGTTPAALRGEEEPGDPTPPPAGDGDAELRAEVHALRDEIAALRRYLMDPEAVREAARRLG